MLPRDLTAALGRALAGRTYVRVAMLFGSGARGTAAIWLEQHGEDELA